MNQKDSQADPTATLGPRVAPDQVEAERARTLLELAGIYARQALAMPEEVAHLRTITAELLLENGMLRLDVRDLAARVERLERRRGRP